MGLEAATTQQDARRVPRVQAATVASALPRAADLMLGLKTLARHASSERAPAKSKRVKTMQAPFTPWQQQPARSMPSPAAQISATPVAACPQRPALLPPLLGLEGTLPATAQDNGGASTQSVAASFPFASFLGRKNKRDEERGPNNRIASPTSVWEGASTTASSSTTPVSPATTHAAPAHTSIERSTVTAKRPWHAPKLALPAAQQSPTLQSRPSPAATPPPLTPAQQPQPVAAAATTRPPPLVRKSSRQWRQDMPAQDRVKTRERIQRGLHKQCHGDYETLLRIVAAMEEELLHVHTTSKDHYFLQTMALRDRITSVPSTAHSSTPRAREA